VSIFTAHVCCTSFLVAGVVSSPRDAAGGASRETFNGGYVWLRLCFDGSGVTDPAGEQVRGRGPAPWAQYDYRAAAISLLML
jgi:hypothetical protein